MRSGLGFRYGLAIEDRNSGRLGGVGEKLVEVGTAYVPRVSAALTKPIGEGEIGTSILSKKASTILYEKARLLDGR